MTWVDLIENPKAVQAYYDAAPDLTSFELHDYRFNSDGPCLHVRGNLKEFANRPSPRWHADCNVVQISLVFIGLESFESKGVATEIVGPLDIRSASSKIEFSFCCGPFSFSGKSGWFRLDQLEGYVDERRLTSRCSGRARVR